MRITVFASGSDGNCLLVDSGDTRLLIDVGISYRRISNGLHQVPCTWQDIDGVLITHEHSDHIYALRTMLGKETVPVYAPHTVASRLFGMFPGIEATLHIIPVGEPFSVGSLKVGAFHTPHDTDESVGYRVEGDAVFGLSTDMGCVTEEILHGLSGADTVLVEANHDVEMLSYGPYPVSLKRRILSARGHLSNDDCAALARTLAQRGTRQIVLGHLSKTNNRPQLALDTVGAALEGTEVSLCCASPDGLLTLDVGGDSVCRL